MGYSKANFFFFTKKDFPFQSKFIRCLVKDAHGASVTVKYNKKDRIIEDAEEFLRCILLTFLISKPTQKDNVQSLQHTGKPINCSAPKAELYCSIFHVSCANPIHHLKLLNIQHK